MTSLNRTRSASPPITALTLIGRGTLRLLGNFGAMAIFFSLAFVNIFRRKQLHEIVSQIFYIGARSSLIVLLVGLFTGVLLLGTNGGAYFYRVRSSLSMADIRGGFIKALVFGAIVSCICCFQGYFCHMRTDGYGAKSVGLATVSAVVLSCVMILIADYVVTSFLM
jgi:phospholipid/cholesterol/gamma-HCH transport system permease protein